MRVNYKYPKVTSVHTQTLWLHSVRVETDHSNKSDLCIVVSPPLFSFLSFLPVPEARLAAGRGEGGGEGEEMDGGGRKKRSGSNSKSISLELTYKSGGLEHKLVLSPATSQSRKQGTEWLKALKKVRPDTHTRYVQSTEGIMNVT